MPSLECSVRNCFYNTNNKCCLDSIEVEGDEATTTDATACGSFKLKGESASNACSCREPSKELEIDCQAHECTYNKEEVCHAPKVDIAGISAEQVEETECGTFRMK